MSLPWVVLGCTRTNPMFGADDAGTDGSSGPVASDTISTSSPDGSASDSAEGSTGDDGPVCGDRAVEGDEQCDQGEDNRNDGACLANCRLNVCGDEHVGPMQPCDDGNDIDDDACTNDCRLRTCLNGVLDEGEECDPTAAVGGLPECTQKCQINECHDGERFGNEACDDGNLDNTDACVGECEQAACGDNYLHDGVEECDDGNQDNSDACAACAHARCGDGFIHVGFESCDPESGESFACETHQFFAGEGACSGNCELDLSQCTNCGDGIIDPGEECEFDGVVTCASEDLSGSGDVSCNACQYEVVEGDCCLPAGSPCYPDGGEDLCCTECGKNNACVQG